ncbi:MAG: ribonuclease HII [Candidatus Nanohaloarchaea archaeon]|nr:ribonuclease HII [Candidatus Nanohaloarchaea archaeon]
MSKLVLGADEAGRGPVIGSLFVAGIVIPQERLDELEKLDLKDSKKLSDGKRRRLEPRIRESMEKILVKEITASEIDELRKIMNLNEIELKAFAEIVAELKPKRAYIDLPEPDGERFARKIKEELEDSVSEELEIVAEHGADDEYPIVSAASIIAKNAREDHVNRLKEKYDYDFKSGYPHDKPTIEFLQQYLEKNGELPEETRMSWSTAERIIKEKQQGSLDEF